MTIIDLLYTDTYEIVSSTEQIGDQEIDNAIVDWLIKPGEWQQSKTDNDQTPTDFIKRIEGVVIGRLVQSSDSHNFVVDYPGNPCNHPLPVTTVTKLNHEDIGKEVGLVFEGGDPRRPIILGLIHQPQTPAGSPIRTSKSAQSVDVRIDGERLTLTAEKEIVLKCGKASITLTQDGKILIRGAYVSSRSSGVNRIKGGSVQIN
jgi:hypothetical protein